MKYLFNHLYLIENKIKRYNSVVLFLDYDGTLTPIVKTPNAAVCSAKTRKILKDLAGQNEITICIISGRSLEDIKSKVKIKNIYYGGCHGLKLSGPKINFTYPEILKYRPVIRKINSILKSNFKKFTGVLIENKKLTVAFHYRNLASSLVPKAKKIFYDILKPYKGKIRITHGKKVLEVRPFLKWDKGKACRHILKLLKSQKGTKKMLPVYIGDDITDEDAFKSLKKTGVTVLVSPHPKKSEALYFLRSSQEVFRLLKELKN